MAPIVSKRSTTQSRANTRTSGMMRAHKSPAAAMGIKVRNMILSESM
jgi:hypothetical protein